MGEWVVKDGRLTPGGCSCQPSMYVSVRLCMLCVHSPVYALITYLSISRRLGATSAYHSLALCHHCLSVALHPLYFSLPRAPSSHACHRPPPAVRHRRAPARPTSTSKVDEATLHGHQGEPCTWPPGSRAPRIVNCSEQRLCFPRSPQRAAPQGNTQPASILRMAEARVAWKQLMPRTTGTPVSAA